MNDESRLERVLSEQLQRRADEAEPPSDGWQRFAAGRGSRLDGSGAAADAVIPITDVVLIDDDAPQGSNTMSLKWMMSGVVAAAAAVILIVWAVASAGSGDGDGSRAGLEDDPVVPPITATAPAPPATDAPPVATSTEQAVSVVEGVFAAYDQGDMDAVMAAFSADAVFDEAGVGPPSQFSSRDGFEILWAWDIAQGTDKVDRACAADDGGDVVVVTCTFGDHQYLGQAVGAPAITNTLEAVVADGTITSLSIRFGQPNYIPTLVPFVEWAAMARPDVADLVGCCGGDSVAEAQQRGAARRALVDEWAAHLDATGCIYDEPCPAGDAVALLRGRFVGYEVGDMEQVMAGFAPDAIVQYFGSPSTLDEFEILWTWDLAQQTQKNEVECEAEGGGDDGASGVTVMCSFDDHQHVSRVVGGPPVPNFFTATVSDDAIVLLNHQFAQPDYNTVSESFHAWLGEVHPESADVAGCCAGESVAEAQQRGEERVRLADEWAFFLEQSGCSYTDPC